MTIGIVSRGGERFRTSVPGRPEREINEKRATGVNETMAGHVSTNRRRGKNPTLRVRSAVRWSLSR